MFLPRPTFPSSHLREETNDTPGTGTSRKSQRSNLHGWSSNAVDSDGDEHISEADRDARLASVDPCCHRMP